MTLSYVADTRRTSPIRRITEGRQQWRVLVETWAESDQCFGRLVFRPETSMPWESERESSAMLSGRSVEDVVFAAYDMPDETLKRVLHSLV